jgi:hypothetical protein
VPALHLLRERLQFAALAHLRRRRQARRNWAED